MGHKTIREIAVVWKDSKRPFVKQSTMAAYVLILENHILPTFGECDSLHEKIVQDYVLRKIENGLSVKSVKDILIVLKMVMKFGMKNEWMDYYEWENLKGHAAICSKAAAERYGMKVLQEGIETNKHNFTRFLVVADPWQVDELRQHHANATNKASIVFTLPHTEGSLSQVLSILSFYNINLTKIQSLPIIGREWEYQFYVDVAFNDYLRYKQSIAAITPLTKELKLLGEYAEGKSNV